MNVDLDWLEWFRRVNIDLDRLEWFRRVLVIVTPNQDPLRGLNSV